VTSISGSSMCWGSAVSPAATRIQEAPRLR
jgi:hypothetical protein